MPLKCSLIWPTLALALNAVTSALATPGMITTSLSSMGPVLVGQTVTATFRISGYTDAAEIDGFTFKVSFPGSIFMYVGGVNEGDTTAGPDQQWLRKPNQEEGIVLNTILDSEPGMVTVTALDSLSSGPEEKGTVAESGFLVAFNLLTTGIGTGDITLSPSDGQVLLGVEYVPAGVPTLAGASFEVIPVPEPGTIALLVTGGIGLLILRQKRRRQG